jgi:hypothetical protein
LGQIAGERFVPHLPDNHGEDSILMREDEFSELVTFAGQNEANETRLFFVTHPRAQFPSCA